jgi:hypothetical protein
MHAAGVCDISAQDVTPTFCSQLAVPYVVLVLSNYVTAQGPLIK